MLVGSRKAFPTSQRSSREVMQMAEPSTPASSSLSRQAPADVPAALAGTEVLTVSPFHQQIVEDLRWASEQYACGHFDQWVGMYVAVLDKKTLGEGYHVGRLLERVTQA